MGYPRFGAFINSDESFLPCRQYGYLRSRVLLYRQDELSMLERQLTALDQDDFETSDETRIAVRSRTTDDSPKEDPRYARKTLIQTIDDKLKEYGQYSTFFLYVGLG